MLKKERDPEGYFEDLSVDENAGGVGRGGGGGGQAGIWWELLQGGGGWKSCLGD